jgi:hypothetical protein
MPVRRRVPDAGLGDRMSGDGAETGNNGAA